MYLHETSRTVGIFHLPALVFEIWAFTFAKMEVGHPVPRLENFPVELLSYLTIINAIPKPVPIPVPELQVQDFLQ